MWIFGLQEYPAGKYEFKDNSKYMFLHLSNKSYQVRPIWLTYSRQLAAGLSRRGYEAYYILSYRGMKCLLRAGCVVSHTGTGPVESMLFVNKTKLELWHGVPLKKLAVSILADYLCGTSESLRELFARCLGVPPARIVVSGYPRNDVLLESIPGYEIGVESYLKEIRVIRKQARILLYAPTFRDYLKEGTFEEFLREIPLAGRELDVVLERHGACLLINFHHFLKSGGTECLLQKMSDRVYMIGRPIDIYPIMREAEMLVTDYSSIFFDFLLLDRPIVFYVPDYERYRRTRGFALDFDAFTPGPKATTFAELVTVLGNALRGEDNFRGERKKVREYIFDYCDGNSSERVSKSLMTILKLEEQNRRAGTAPTEKPDLFNNGTVRSNMQRDVLKRFT
jgi:CDP-glycerol glycerophosphotransferase (TagB/SpsB family)